MEATPIIQAATAAPCDGKNWFGWSCDDELEKRRLAYLDATDDAGRRQAVERLQARYFEVLPFIPLGQFTRPVAHRICKACSVNRCCSAITLRWSQTRTTSANPSFRHPPGGKR